jgi:putative two-component system response regulator
MENMISIDKIKNAKILIVDDIQSNIDLISAFLKQEKYTNIDYTTNPTEVINLYSKNQYDLIILDLNMPIMSGFDIMNEFKRNFPQIWIPIVVITAQNEHMARLRALSLGARDFIVKPIEKAETITRIRNIIENKLQQIELENEKNLLELKVLERTKEVTNSYYELIASLIRAAEYRDNETGNHITRMSLYSKELTYQYTKNDNLSNLIFKASPMHDIGKIGIPDAILTKPGKLTPEEFEIMKTHTEKGYCILSQSNSPIIMTGAEIALSHHEKWDGTGYPKGLKGELIPISARIVAVADVFDALTSVRPYKKAWTNQEAINFINEQKGQHFDPEIVEVFNKSLNNILNIQQKYNDSNTVDFKNFII